VRTRGIDPVLLAEISKPSFNPIILMEIDWPTGAVRAHSNVGDVRFLDETWIGVGAFGRVDVPAETRDGVARRLSATLFGAPADQLDEILQTRLRGREGRIYLGAVREATGNELIGRPHLIYSGTVDANTFTLGRTDGPGDVQTAVQLDFVSGPPLRRKAGLFHTQEDHNLIFPNDTAGRHVQAADTNATNRRWPE